MAMVCITGCKECDGCMRCYNNEDEYEQDEYERD